MGFASICGVCRGGYGSMRRTAEEAGSAVAPLEQLTFLLQFHRYIRGPELLIKRQREIRGCERNQPTSPRGRIRKALNKVEQRDLSEQDTKKDTKRTQNSRSVGAPISCVFFVSFTAVWSSNNPFRCSSADKSQSIPIAEIRSSITPQKSDTSPV